MRRIRLFLFLALAIAWLALAAPALAHANLVRSEPAANSAQKTPPTAARLWFTEDVEPSFSSVQVLDRSGTQVDKGDSHRMADDPKGMQISLNPLPQGLYTVVWKTTSAVDGHVTAGSFAFTVGDVPLAESSPRQVMSLVDSALAADASPPLYQVAVRWLNLLLLTLLVGALMFPLVILFPAVRALATRQPILTVYRSYLRGDKIDAGMSLDEGRTRWLAFIRIAFVLFVVMTFVTLVAQAFAVGTGVESVVRVLTATRFGIIWLFRIALLIALGFILWRVPTSWNDAHPGRTFLTAAAIGLLLLVTQSLNSHDAALDAPPVLPFLTDWVHLLGVVVWVGGLVQLLVVAPVLIARRPRLLASLVSTFSLVAFTMVGAVIITGIYSAYLQVGSLDAFFATLYGTTLFIKLVLILPLLALGALNLIVTRPFAAQVIDARVPAFARRFDVAVALEVLLAAAVLLVVGAMTSLAPAKSAYNPSPALFVETLRAEDLYVTLGIAPGLVGTNDFDIKVRDLNGAPVTNATVVRLLATMRDMGMGTQEVPATNQGNGHYTLHADMLSMVGNWDLGVLVRRGGVDDVRASFSMIALGQRIPPTSIDAMILQDTPALEGLGLTVFAFAIGAASVLVVKKRKARLVALGGAMAVALIGAFVVYQSAPTNAATAYVVPTVPPTARLVRSPIAPVPAQIAAGQQIYQQNCAVCHGVSGKGDGPQAATLTPRPADLTVHARQHTEGELYWWVTNGIATTAMPAWQASLTDTQRWQVVQFIRTLGTNPAVAPAGAVAPPPTVLFAHPAPDVNLALTVAGQNMDAFVTDANKQPADVHNVGFEFTWLDQNSEVKSMDVQPGESGHFRTTGDYVSQPGMWLIRVIIHRKNGPDLTASFPFPQSMNATRSTTNDPSALALLRQSDAQMDTLKTLRATEELNDGANAVVTTQYEYHAPDRLRFHVSSGGNSIAVGGTQYYLENGTWTSRPRVDPFVFPSFDNAKQAHGAKLGRTDTLNGIPTQVVEFSIPAGNSNADYAYWIGTQDHRVHQYVMVAPSHFMMQDYFDFDAPLDIQAPAQPGGK